MVYTVVDMLYSIIMQLLYYAVLKFYVTDATISQTCCAIDYTSSVFHNGKHLSIACLFTNLYTD